MSESIDQTMEQAGTPDFRHVTYGVHTRLKSVPSPELRAFFERRYHRGFDSIAFDAAYQINLAHVVMLVETGIVSRTDGAQLIRTLREVRDLGYTAFELNPDLGDPLPNIENYIIGRLGDRVGGMLHTGRSRGDFYVAVSRIGFRHRLRDLMEAVLSFRTLLVELVDDHVETLVPGYTHLQHAQPITLGHYFLAFVHQHERDFERLTAAYGRLNRSPMGLGIIGGSSYPLDRARVAFLLGFEGLIRNGRDLSDRDYAAEIASDCSILMMHLHRLATDLYIWSTSEFALVRCDDSDVITSSIMPQKANPVLLETALASTALVHADLTAVLGTLKGSSANNTEAGRADAPALHALDETSETLTTISAVLSRIHVDRALMARRAGEHWSQATDLADALVQTTDLSFRQAHRVVGAVVARTLDAGIAPSAVSPALIREVALQVLGIDLEVPLEAVSSAVDPWQGVQRRQLPGGPAPGAVRPLLAEAREQLAGDRRRLEQIEQMLAEARRQLEAVADQMAG